jgi:hypothetical protein
VADLLLSVLLGAGFLGWAFGIVVTLLMIFLYPLLAIALVRHVKGVRTEIARLNSNLERLPAPRPTANGNGDPAADAATYVPGTHTRTGPLHIR